MNVCLHGHPWELLLGWWFELFRYIFTRLCFLLLNLHICALGIPSPDVKQEAAVPFAVLMGREIFLLSLPRPAFMASSCLHSLCGEQDVYSRWCPPSDRELTSTLTCWATLWPKVDFPKIYSSKSYLIWQLHDPIKHSHVPNYLSVHHWPWVPWWFCRCAAGYLCKHILERLCNDRVPGDAFSECLSVVKWFANLMHKPRNCECKKTMKTCDLSENESLKIKVWLSCSEVTENWGVDHEEHGTLIASNTALGLHR